MLKNTIRIIATLLITFVMFSCSEDDSLDQNKYWTNNVSGCGQVRDYAVENDVAGNVVTILWVLFDGDTESTAVHVDRQTYYEFNTGDRVCW